MALTGQVMEILTMFVLPFMLAKLGFRATITIGILAWGVRFFVFSLVEPRELVIASQAIHGICFAFSVAAAMLYVERISTPDVRGSMQSFLSFLTYGLGMFVGSICSGQTLEYFGGDWRRFWQVSAAGCLAAGIIFALAFRARNTQTQEPPA